MRKLASVQKIREIHPIPDSEYLEKAVINSWPVVIKKGEFKVGDLVVYCEPDSFLPIRPEYEFLRASSYKKMGEREGFRLKTIRLRKQLSQGLILPLGNIPEEEGLDVSDLLDIVKYEQPLDPSIAGDVEGVFPGFLRKTDEERIQNLTNEYETWKNKSIRFTATEKLHGTSTTFFKRNGEFGVCSRNYRLKESEGNALWRMAKKLEVEKWIPDNYVIQGELIGPKICDNMYQLTEHQFYGFNAFDINSDFVDNHVKNFAKYINIVPEIHTIYLPDTIEELLLLSDGKSIINPSVNREGLVYIREGQKKDISFKAISNKWLEKEK